MLVYVRDRSMWTLVHAATPCWKFLCSLCNSPSSMLVYVRDRSMWTLVHAATPCWKLQIELAISLNHSVLTHGQSCTDPITPGTWQINNSSNNNDDNNNNNNNNNNHIERHNSRFLQSPHCTTNCLQHKHSSSLGTIMCKSHATHWVLFMYNMLCVIWCKGIAKLHLFELYFTGWTIDWWRRGGNWSILRKTLMTGFGKYHIY